MSLFALLLLFQTAMADSSCNVHVDCASHIISVNVFGSPKLSRIDCGKPGHESVDGTGTIGGLHNGPIVHDGVEIVNFPGMGASGGGKVFHCTPGGPKGINDSNGCIHVDPLTLSELKNCQGSSLSITGVGQGPFQPTAADLAAMPSIVQQQYYGTNDTYPSYNRLQPGAVQGYPDDDDSAIWQALGRAAGVAAGAHK